MTDDKQTRIISTDYININQLHPPQIQKTIEQLPYNNGCSGTWDIHKVIDLKKITNGFNGIFLPSTRIMEGEIIKMNCFSSDTEDDETDN